MKIGMFTDSYHPSRDGVATSVASVSQELKKRGHVVYIIAPQHPHIKDRKNIFRIFSVQLFKEPDIRIGLEIPQPSLLKISTIDFDIIHGHSGGPISFLGWQLALVSDRPFVETYHTLWKYYRHYFLFPRLIKPGLVKRIHAWFGNDCDALIAPTQKVKKTLLSYGIKKPIYVVPTGIVRSNFSHHPAGYLHTRLRIPTTTKIILSVGRLEKEKSMDFVLHAFSAAQSSCPQSALVIVGEGRNKKKMEQYIFSHGLHNTVHLPGAIEHTDMPKVYADSDLFVFASQTETQGIVIAEALASGVPVITVDDAAFYDMVKDGYNGYLLDKTIDAFAKKITEILHNDRLRKKLGHNARDSSKDFSAQKTAAVLEMVYTEVIKNKSAHTQRSLRTFVVALHTYLRNHLLR